MVPFGMIEFAVQALPTLFAFGQMLHQQSGRAYPLAIRPYRAGVTAGFSFTAMRKT